MHVIDWQVAWVNPQLRKVTSEWFLKIKIHTNLVSKFHLLSSNLRGIFSELWLKIWKEYQIIVVTG